MARIKVTSSDINARLAKGECANYRNGCCQGRTPCTIVMGEACEYFNVYVRPLLDNPDVAQRYAREAKIKLALNPDTKVVRKRRPASPSTTQPEPKPGKLPSAKDTRATPARTVVPPSRKPESAPAPIAEPVLRMEAPPARVEQPIPQQPAAQKPDAREIPPQLELVLELTPEETPSRRRVAARR